MGENTLIVLDASALLALALGEPVGDFMIQTKKAITTISTVNMAEVQSRLVKIGHPPDKAWEDALSFVTMVEPYTAEQAKIAGNLITQTQRHGLSLGDRSCLALAMVLNSPVYTTDRIWQTLNIGIPIHILR